MECFVAAKQVRCLRVFHGLLDPGLTDLFHVHASLADTLLHILMFSMNYNEHRLNNVAYF